MTGEINQKKWQGLNDPAMLFKDSVEILFYKYSVSFLIIKI
jgi:hypothetical protein